MKIRTNIANSVVVGYQTVSPGTPVDESWIKDKEQLASALQQGLLARETEPIPELQEAEQQPEGEAKGKAKAKPKSKSGNAKPFSFDPKELEGLTLDELNAMCLSALEASFPEGKQADEKDYADFPLDSIEKAVAFLSRNFGK